MPQLRIEHMDPTPAATVAAITLDDPEHRNSLSIGLCEELTATMSRLEADDRTGAVVITGAGRAFCAGADLSELGDSRREGLLSIYEGFLSVARSPLPTVAAVNGPAVGAGMNLALACDVRIAGQHASFDCRFLDLGIHPGGGHTWMLSRLVGPQTASAMVVFGQVLDASQATRVGLAWEQVDGEELLQRAVEIAARAASMPHELARTTGRTIAEMADVATLDDAVALELGRQLHSMDQPAFSERLAALRRRISSADRATRR